MIPSAYIKIYLPGVFNYYNFDLNTSLIDIILSATAFNSSLHCWKLFASDKTF